MGALSGDRLAEVEVPTAQALHDWLAAHHDQREGVWLVRWKKVVPARYVTTDEVLDALVAYGWCDGPQRRVDDERVLHRVSPRRTQPWARSYKVRAERLAAEGRMRPRGAASVERARATGMWDAHDDVDALVVPDDLAAALTARPPAAEVFAGFAPSTRRNLLRWVASARTPPTREKRVRLTAEEAQAGRAAKSHG